jgi:uncharacterized protein YbjT (DUF2867 family)
MQDPHIPNTALRVVMLGASGAVGGEVLRALRGQSALKQLTLLNRRALPQLQSERAEVPTQAPTQTHSPVIQQHVVDVLNPAAYQHLLPGHQAAVCTLGVGQPSKVSDAEFVRIDKDAVLAFASACKHAGVAHFELLSSVGVDAQSRSLYLRTKGELCDALVALRFERLSLFQPSMILTPTNRYGLMQALTLALWPRLNPLLGGTWRKYRGIRVEQLGAAMANHLFTSGHGVERLQWDEFIALTQRA